MIHVAIPVQDEAEHLPGCIRALARQDDVNFVAWFCVNQPEAWHADPERHAITEANRTCLKMLEGVTDLDTRVIDRASPGAGWPPKRSGVGFARKPPVFMKAGDRVEIDISDIGILSNPIEAE